jgi:ribosomal protein L3
MPRSLIKLAIIAPLIHGNVKPARWQRRKQQSNTSNALRKSGSQSKNLPPQPMKARVTEKGNIAGILVDAAKKVLADVQRRCTEALKALDQHDYLVVIGALTGLEEQIRYVTVRLMVLREIREMQNQTTRRNK